MCCIDIINFFAHFVFTSGEKEEAFYRDQLYRGMDKAFRNKNEFTREEFE